MGEGSERVLSTDASGITWEVWGACWWSRLAPRSRLLTLGILGGVGGINAALIWVHVFFIGRASLRHCAIVGFEVFFPLLHATHVGELCPVMAKPVPYESHPELTSQFWRCCLKHCLDFKGHFRNKSEGNFLSILNWEVVWHYFCGLMQLCQYCEKTCQLYLLKQNKANT